MGEVRTLRPCLVTAARCVALRMLDVIAEFSMNGEWNEELIDKWQAAFTTLEALDKWQLCQLPSNHQGINLLYACMLLAGHSVNYLSHTCSIIPGHPETVDEPSLRTDER